ncbi:ABC transporter substrate-binding protein [Loigolactobacillus binensis]|uniref:ABC transporter substrate-binding protein n=1 Tax=Loigolactobacillus binensis TaxID=2559922 RepID=A0ABW3E7X3_9LACO|nr:ABC transporter substrate-binding protein [Loigolactobacillus binensis]
MSKLKRRIITIVAAITMVLPFATLGNSASTNAASTVNAAATSKTVTVTDQAGDKVTVPKNSKRIAVVGIWPLPAVITTFFNSSSRLVYMPQASMAAAKNDLLSELYPNITKVKAVNDNGGATFNTEELKKARPDIVFYTAENPKTKAKLEQAGFKAVGVSTSKWHGNTIETLDNWYSLLSKLYPQKKSQAKVIKNYSDKTYNRVQKQVKTIPTSQRKSVFFLHQYAASTLSTGGSNSFADYWAKATGTKQVVKNAGAGNGLAVTMEQIYKWNPQLIFVTNFTTAQPKDLYNNTIGNYDWSKVAAVQNKHVYKMPLGMYRSYTPGVDTPLTLLWMAKTAYPSKFKDVNMVKEAKTYYKKAFKVNLTTKQAKSIFNPSSAAGKSTISTQQ